MSQLKNPVSVPISMPVVTSASGSQTPTTITVISTPGTSRNLSPVHTSQHETNFPPPFPALESPLNFSVLATQFQASVLETF